MPAKYLATGRSAGEECSSTYESRHLTLAESELAHPTHADGFVDKGDPVIDAGGQNIVGVALLSAAAATDLISLDTEGIWFLSVVGSDDAGNSAVQYGDQIFINTTTAVLSKITNINTQRSFGYALGTVATGTTAVVAVRVHWDPSVDNDVAMYATVATTAYGKSMRATLADPGQSEGLCDYQEGHIEGVTAGHIYNHGSWINCDTGCTLTAGHIIVPYEGGVYTADAQAAARIVFGGQHQAILTGAPASLYCWRLNTTQTITAVIAAANAGSVGFAAGAATTSTKNGDVPMFDVVGTGVVWMRTYDAAG